MKKFALLASGVLALGLGVFCACTPTTEPNPGGDDPINDPTNFNEEMGAYADIYWISQDGLLDLSTNTFEGASSFAVTGVQGSGDDIVISCTADDVDYNLTLNVDGALEMRTAADNTLVRTFMGDASLFAGAWYDEDGTDGMYYVISSTLDEDGYFSWKSYNQGAYTPGDTSRAVTVFQNYDDGSAGMYFGVPSEEDESVIDVSYYYSSNTIYMNDGSVTGSVQLAPYSGVFSTVYRNNDGDEITLDLNNSLAYINGEDCLTQFGTTVYGAGISFTYDSVEYALVYMNEGTYLYGGDQTVMYAPYDSSWLVGRRGDDGEWSDGTGIYPVSFEDDSSVNFNGTTHPLGQAVNSGDLVYTFTAGGVDYLIRPVAGSYDVFTLESSTASRFSGQYFRKSHMDTYVRTYSNNSEELVVNSSYEIALTTHVYGQQDTTQRYGGTFVYLEDLGAIALSYSFGQGGASLYFTIVDSRGVYWSLAGSTGSYAVYSTYFNEEYLPQATEQVENALSGEDDYFTTGGVDADTMRFDFDEGLVYVNGAPSYFTWGYGYITSVTEPEIYIMINGEEEGTATNYEYDRYTIYPSNEGIRVEFTTVTVDENAGTAIPSEDVEEYFYISANIFDHLRSTTFVYYGQYVNSSLYFDENGAIVIYSYNYGTDNEQLLTLTPYDYTLQLSYNSNGEEVITITYEVGGEEYTVVVTDRLYATVNSLVYCISDLADVAGTYIGADNSYITVTTNGRITVNGVVASGVEFSSEEGLVTATYTLNRVSYTATFDGTTATTFSSEGVTVTYDSKATFTPENFVGTYVFGNITIGVTSSVSQVNEIITLQTTINGEIISHTLTYEDGVQVLSFSGRDFQSWTMVNCTMRLNGDSLVVTVNNESRTVDAADWSYDDFVFEGEQEVRNDLGNVIGVLECVVKEGAPIYLFNDVLCDNYTVSISDGVKTLQIHCGDTDIYVSVNADGELSVHA